MRWRGALLAAVAALASCGDDAAPSPDQQHDTAMATALCGALRDQTNELVRIANRAVAGIEGKSPQERFEAIDSGFVEAHAAATTFAEDVETLELPDVAERDSLRQQVAEGAEQAVAEVTDERELFEQTGPTVEDADTRGRVGEFFNSIEKVMSVVEPSIATYDRRALQEAFLAEPTCSHVIQPFRLDD
jgi:hypothetical protein